MKTIRTWLVPAAALALLLNAPIGFAQVKITTRKGPQAVVFRPDGRWIAAGLVDGTVKQWDVETGTLVRSLAAHEKYADTVAVSRDGRYLVSG